MNDTYRRVRDPAILYIFNPLENTEKYNRGLDRQILYNVYLNLDNF